MRRLTTRWLPAALVAAGMVASALAQDYLQDADEEKVALDQVPAAVKERANTAGKGVTFARAYRDKAKNFRLVGKNADGALVVVQTTEEGQFVSLTTRTPSSVKAVPRAVTKALDAERKKNAAVKGFRAQSIEEADVFTAARAKMDHLFQFRGVNGEGDPIQVDVTPEGKVVSAKVVLTHPDAAQADVAGAEATSKGAQLPPELAAAVREAVPGMQITGSTEQKSAGGIASYLVAGRDGQGHKVAVDVGTNGTVATVKYDLANQEVPPQALAMAIEAAQSDQRLAGFRPDRTQRLELRQLGQVVFAFTGKSASGAAFELHVPTDGGNVSVVPATPDKADGAEAATADGKKTGKKTTRKKSR